MILHDLNQFLGGAILMGEISVALLFLQFWRRTRDRLFGWFAAAFVLLVIERVLLFWNMSAHNLPTVYLTRLLAFGFIIFAVIDRNRRGAS